MHFTEFSTREPLCHLPRALDELARAGFVLHALQVQAEHAISTIRIEFEGKASVEPNIYVERIAKMPGVGRVTGGMFQRDAAAEEEVIR